MEVQKYDYIDALRGWAILGVILSHLFEVIRTNSNLMTWIIPNIGARGVQLFFIVSACTLFLSMKKRETVEKKPIINFYIRRYFRIAPLFYAIILYYVWISSFAFSWQEIVSVLTFTNGWNPYWLNNIVPGQWTLVSEVLFYIFLPFLFIRIKHINPAIFSFVVCFFLSWLLVIYFSNTSIIESQRLWERFMYRFPLAQFQYFFLAMVLFFLISENYIKDHFTRIRDILFTSIIWTSILCLVTKIVTPNFAIFYHVLIFTESIIMFLGVIYLIKYPHKLFINPIITYVGKISYSVYLTHFIILGFLINKMGPIFSLHGVTPTITLSYWAIYLFCFFVGTLVLSSATYYYIERPGQGVGRQIIKKI